MAQGTPSPDGPGQRLIAFLLLRILRFSRRSASRGRTTVADQRRRILRLSRATRVPRGVTFTPGEVGGVPGEWVQASGGAATETVVLYLHGGAYCIGSPVTHRAITSRLALRAPARVFALDYRLAPEHPFPAAVDDACTAYSGLVASGVRPERIVIAGDSAGGGLTVAAAMRLRLLRHPLPAALYLICPWANLHRGQSPALQGNVPCDEFERDWISRDWLDECANFYLAGHDAADPLASPVHGDTSGLPPTLIQAGEDELLLGDARQLHASMRAAGIATTLTVHPRRWHVFQVHGGMLRDADRALDEAAAFMRDRAGG